MGVKLLKGIFRWKSYFMLFLLLQVSMILFGQSSLAVLPEKGMSLEELVPDGWNILNSVTGDLNKDGLTDLVLAVQNTDKSNIILHDGLGRDTVDLNPRVLGIYFGQNDGHLVKKLESNQIILIRDIPTMDEPFDGFLIHKNGVLQIDFHIWFSAGSWYTSMHSYKFRYQNDRFELIGYDGNSLHRGTMENYDYSINFSTGKMRVVHTTLDMDTEKESSVEEWKSFKLPTLKTIKSLGKPLNWEFQGIYL